MTHPTRKQHRILTWLHTRPGEHRISERTGNALIRHGWATCWLEVPVGRRYLITREGRAAVRRASGERAHGQRGRANGSG